MHAVTPEKSRPRVTVAAIVEQDGRYLLVEEYDAHGQLVLNQPAGHLEAGESVPEALVRQALEVTGWQVEPIALVGVYLWGKPERDVSYLRVALAARGLRHDPAAPLDDGIVRAVWLTRDELAACRERHRSELVLRCVDDHRSGESYPLAALKTLLS